MTLTAKEKAKELVDRFIPHTNSDWDIEIEQAKQCALTAADEIQNTKSVYVNDVEYNYWEEVKSEIVKL